MSELPYGLHEEPGWTGIFTRDQAPEALANGTRIRKSVFWPGDATSVGTTGTVVGSLSHPRVYDGMIFYFVAWDDDPRCAVGIIGAKIAPLEGQP